MYNLDFLKITFNSVHTSVQRFVISIYKKKKLLLNKNGIKLIKSDSKDFRKILFQIKAVLLNFLIVKKQYD